MKTLSVYLRRLTLLLLSLTLFVGQITGRGANNIQALQQQLSDVVAENELVRLVTTQAIHNEEMLTRIQNTLSDALKNPNQNTLKVQRRTPRHLKHFAMKTIASISNDIEKSATILEVITPDRPGLLAHLGRIFIHFRLRLLSAKISTLGERVEDVFHLVDMDYQPLSDPIFCEQLRDAVCRGLDKRNKEDIEGAPLQTMKLWQ